MRGQIRSAQDPQNWARNISNRMVQNLPTPTLRAKHFHEDARLAWAVGTGKMPSPVFSVPTAPPHDYAVFVDRFDEWNEAGAPCP